MTRSRHRRPDDAPARGDAGVTMVELVVSMSITVVFFSVFATLGVKVFDSAGNQQARGLNTDVARGVSLLLDRQVRYANAVNPPQTVGGSEYDEWRSGGTGARQTCWQWRATPGGLLQYRSWLLPLVAGDPAAASTATSWTTAGNGVSGTGGNPVFSLTAPVGATGALSRQQLTVAFTSTHGRAVTTPTVLTLTALNTTTSAAPALRVCQEVPAT